VPAITALIAGHHVLAGLEGSPHVADGRFARLQVGPGHLHDGIRDALPNRSQAVPAPDQFGRLPVVIQRARFLDHPQGGVDIQPIWVIDGPFDRVRNRHYLGFEAVLGLQVLRIVAQYLGQPLSDCAESD
jgi:hypothetical protein